MFLFILRTYLNANTSYKNYPEWAIYLALLITTFLIYIFFKNIFRKKKGK